MARSQKNFLTDIIDADLAAGRHTEVVTRFPPEPNGFLHIGHAKSICLNFGLAEQYGGRCHLRFDDTNPETEELAYVESIQADVKWLGFEWDELRFASDYFEQFHAFAVELIQKGLAYVDSCSEEEIREMRGTVTEAGTESPHRSRSVEENLALFQEMKHGKHPDGAHVLRAKGDMSAPNMKMRDPLLYRIRQNAHHYRRGDDWHIFPMYDFAHCLEDAIERVTHSICTLEFENNRDIYDWVLDRVSIEQPRPHQYEFARLALTYTVMSKRRLLQLVNEGHVSGWDDPRMLTVAGLRRRGVRPEAIRAFADVIGVAKANSTVEMERLEGVIRDDLNHEAPRVMAVLRPLKITLDGAPDETDWVDADLWPHDVPKEGARKLPLTREVFIERDDFQETPEKGFRRLSPGVTVRLRHVGVITCDEVVRDESGEVVELKCTYADEPGEAKVKGTIHWVSATESVPAEVRLYDRLFRDPNPGATKDAGFLASLNPDSLEVVTARIEPFLKDAEAGSRWQFERGGYFFADPEDHGSDTLVFNRTVTLKDTWARQKDATKDTTKAVEPKAEEKAQTPVERAPLSSAAEALVARGVGEEDARVIADDEARAAFFEAAVKVHDAPVEVAKWMANQLRALVKDTSLADSRVDPAGLASLVQLVDAGEVTALAAKDVLAIMHETGDAPGTIVDREGLRAMKDDDALGKLVDEVLAAKADEVARFRAGETKLMGFFVGQVMRASQGKADPGTLQALLREKLG